MKYLKFLVPLVMVGILLAIAVPAFADDPFGATIPSKTSGNGSTTWAAIYIGDNGSWTGKLAPGSAMWFKGDAWIDKPTVITLDDELPNSTKPSGWAVLGTPLRYGYGVAPGDPKRANFLSWDRNHAQGFAFEVWAPPDDLQPNFSYPGPNNGWILTDPQGMPKPDVCAPMLTGNGGANNGACPVGWGAFQASTGSDQRSDQSGMQNTGGQPPKHFLYYRGTWAGWYYIRVYNQMLIDGWFTIRTVRNIES